MSSTSTKLKYSFGPAGNNKYKGDGKPIFLIYFDNENPELLKDRYQISFLNDDYKLLSVSNNKDTTPEALELKSLSLGEKKVKGDTFTFDLNELRSAGSTTDADQNIKDNKAFLYGSEYDMNNQKNINKLEIVSEKLNLQSFNILKYNKEFYSFTNKDDFPTELQQEKDNSTGKIKSKFLNGNFRRFTNNDGKQIFHYLLDPDIDGFLDVNTLDLFDIKKVDIKGRNRNTTDYNNYTLYKGNKYLTKIKDYLKDSDQENKNTKVLGLVNQLLVFVNDENNKSLLKDIHSINDTTVYLDDDNKFKFSNLLELVKKNDDLNNIDDNRRKMGIFSILYKYYKCEDNELPDLLKDFNTKYDINNNKIIVNDDLTVYIKEIEDNIDALCNSELEDDTQEYGEANVNNTVTNSLLTSNRVKTIIGELRKKGKNNKAERNEEEKNKLASLKTELQNSLNKYKEITLGTSEEEQKLLEATYNEKKQKLNQYIEKKVSELEEDINKIDDDIRSLSNDLKKITVKNPEKVTNNNRTIYEEKNRKKVLLKRNKENKEKEKQTLEIKKNELTHFLKEKEVEKKNRNTNLNSERTTAKNNRHLKFIKNSLPPFKGDDIFIDNISSKTVEELKQKLEKLSKMNNSTVLIELNNKAKQIVNENKNVEATKLLQNTKQAIKTKITAINAELERKRTAAAEEARLKAEEEARLKAEEEARLKAEEEARLKAEAKAKAEAEAKARAEAEAKARAKAEEEIAKLKEQKAAATQELEKINKEISNITEVKQIGTFTALLENFPKIRKYCTAIIGFYAMDESTRNADIFKNIKPQLNEFEGYNTIGEDKLNTIHTLNNIELIKALCLGFKSSTHLNTSGEDLKTLLVKMDTLKLNLPTDLDDMVETVLKIPGIIVKIIDDPSEVNKDNEQFVKGVNNCVEIGNGCNELKEEEKGKYGPYRFVAHPSQKEKNYENPTNTDIFNYLKDTYNLKANILDKDAKLKLFGYGFSGSGKTYTLLQGREEDPSLLTQVIKYCKEHEKTVSVSIDMFYPVKDNDKANINEFYQMTDEQGKEMKNALDVKVREINNKIKKPDFNIKSLLEQIEEDILAKYLLVLPTTNNPKSSRAFTIVNLNIGNETKKIQFIDLPGLEKKVDMIKDHYYPTEKKEIIRTVINGKENKKDGNINTDTLLIGEFDTFFSNKNYTQDTLDKQNNNLFISNNSFYVKEISDDMKDYLTIYLKSTKGSNGAEFIIPYAKFNTYGNNKNIFEDKLKLKEKTRYAEYLKQYLLEFILYTNYTTELKPNYMYELPNETKLTEYVLNFKETFLNKNDYKNLEGGKVKQIITNELENTFNSVFNSTVSKTDSTEYFILDTGGIDIIEYKSPALSCLNVIIKILDNLIEIKKNYKLIYLKFQVLFMVMFTKFTLQQGEAIVTSLEHLLFEFLNQTPGGLNNYNKKQDQTKKFTYGENSTEYDYEEREQNTYKENNYIIPGDKTASGMPETVNRKYLDGMKKILDINDNSRFINLLAILRRSETRDGDNTAKRCTGAQETLEFGSTLINANRELCTDEVKIERTVKDEDKENLRKLEEEGKTKNKEIQKFTQKIQDLQSKLQQLEDAQNPEIKTKINLQKNNTSPQVIYKWVSWPKSISINVMNKNSEDLVMNISKNDIMTYTSSRKNKNITRYIYINGFGGLKKNNPERIFYYKIKEEGDTYTLYGKSGGIGVKSYEIWPIDFFTYTNLKKSDPDSPIIKKIRTNIQEHYLYLDNFATTTSPVEGGSRRKRLNTKSKSLTARINTQKSKKNNKQKRRSLKVNIPFSNYRSKKSKK